MEIRGFKTMALKFILNSKLHLVLSWCVKYISTKIPWPVAEK